MLLALLFLLLVGPWMKQLTAQPASRIALTAAIVDRGTIRLDAYESIVGVDRVVREGHVYSDKAPGQPLLAVPAYAMARAVGASPAEELTFEGGPTLWWVTFWSCAIPGALLVWLVHRDLRRSHPDTAVWGAAAVGLGSLLMPFSAELYGHVLAALLGFLAWVVVRPVPAPPRRLVGVGALLGLAVFVEYQMALLALILIAVVALRRLRDVPWVALGGLPFAACLAVYQAAAFGSPLHSSYAEKPVHGTTVAGVPHLGQAVEVLFGARGLFVFAPVLVVGVVGLVGLVRRAGEVRLDAIVSLVVFVAYLGLQSGWANPWGGEMPGPRYLIPAIPFLGLGVAAAWRRVPTLAGVALVGSALAMALPLVTLHLVPDGGGTVVSHVDNIRRFGFAPTVWTDLLRDLGWVVHLVTVLLCALALWSIQRDEPVSTR